MTPAVPATSATPDVHGAARWALPALMLLLLQVALYAWMAPRGFDFTDESYYFHNYLHWRDFTGTVTFFGAYFELPFRAMGQSIGGIRMLSLLLVTASSALLMHEALRYSLARTPAGATMAAPAWAYLVAPMAAAMLYFGYLTTLRAPSYNLLSLCTMALATACLLRTLVLRAAGQKGRAAPLLYGVALGACILSKATTAVVLLCIHLAFFCAVNRDWAVNRLLAMCALITAGVALNFLLLTLVFPGWLASLQEGMAIMRARGGYGMAELAGSVRWELQAELLRSGPWLLLAAIVFALVRRKLDLSSRRVVSAMALLLVGASALAIAADHRGPAWLVLLGGAALALWSLEPAVRRSRAELALMALLLVLPLAFSFGTNMPILRHSAMASLFAFCAVYLRLYRLYHEGLLSAAALAAAACLLCAPALVTQVLALTDVGYTYRQYSALGQQDVAAQVGPSSVRLDAPTDDGLLQLRRKAAAAGYVEGQDMLDFSDNPGLVFALAARPLGTPWMVGGYPGSAAGAARIVEKLDPAAVRAAWVLASPDSKRRIDGWQAMLASRTGGVSHQLADTITIRNPAARDGTVATTVTLELWKPVAESR